MDHTAIRAASVFALVGLVWMVITDVALVRSGDASTNTWPLSVNRAAFVLAASAVVFLLVRLHGRQWERADSQARGSQEALQRSEARYSSLVERVPGVVWLNEVDDDDPSLTHCVYVGPQLVHLLGYTPEEWMADDLLWRDVIHPDDREAVVELTQNADGEGPLSLEYRAFRRGGGIVWIHDEAMLIPADGDGPAYWQGIMVDITATRVQDEALHELTESLRGMFRASPLAIIVLEPDSRVRHWNPAAERMFGWTAKEIIGHPLPFVPADRTEEFDRLLAKTLGGEGVAGFETTRIRKDRSPIAVSMSTARIVAPDGVVTGLIGVVEDITERKRAEARFQAMLDAAPDAMIGVNSDGVIVMANERMEAVFGYHRHELIGQRLEMLLPERFQPVHPAHRKTYFEEPRTRPMGIGLDLAGRRADGTEFPAEISLSSIETADGIVALGAIRDITERQRVGNELVRRQQQQEAVAGLGLAALEGDDLEALLDEASGVVAQTLGVPLTCILELLPDDQTLFFRSGVGWEPGLVGTYTVGRDVPSLSGYAFQVGESVIVDDLRSERRFPPPPNLVRHGVVSGVATLVYGGRRPYGVLEAFATEERKFTRDDVRFLQGISAIIGLAIERERAQTELRAAEERYRNLVENGPAVVYLHAARAVPAHFTYIGPQIVDLLGYPHDAWTADPLFWMSVVHPDDRQRLMDADTLAIEHEAELDIEYRFIANDGREVWVQDRAMLVRDTDSAPLFRQGVMVDVSERRRAEEDRRLALDRQLRLSTRLELLHQIDRDVLSSASIGELAERALDSLRRIVPHDRGAVATIDSESGRFTYVALRSPEVTVEIDLQSERVDEVTRERLSRDVFLVPDIHELDLQTPLFAEARRAGIRSSLTVALRTAGGQVGILALSSRTTNAFDDEAVAIAKEVGSELAVAIAQTRLRGALAERAEELGRLAEERQQMLHRIVRAQEEERERVALELHDGLGQILTSISLFASDLHEDVDERSKPRAMRVNELARRAIADSRQLVWSLRPPELERLGLVPALRRLADDISVPDLTVDLLEEIGDIRLEPESEAVVYRVVQEAVHNAQKHAGASAISILLQRHDGQLTTLVEDNGRGFDPVAIPHGRGLGLIGMRERAELVRGSLVVESATDAGTRVRLLVPIGATPIEGGEGAGE